MARNVAQLIALAVFAFGCGPSAGTNGDGGVGDGDASNRPDADPFRPDALPPPENAAVYAHSSTQLYRVDPDTLVVSIVGSFGWPSGSDTMTDIAIDKDGNMVGISFSKVYAIDKDTAACTYLADLTEMFNGLSYVPGVGPDPNLPERLIGAANSGTVYEINPTTGQATVAGSYGGLLGSSGDIVSVRGLGTFATVTDLSGTDKLASIDPTTFRATIIGDTGFGSIWGLGFWGNKVFGFTDTRKFILIDVTTGQGTEVEPSSINWWGAAVTTSAPVIE